MKSANNNLMRLPRLVPLVAAILTVTVVVAACGSSNTSDKTKRHSKTVTVTKTVGTDQTPTTTTKTSTSPVKTTHPATKTTTTPSASVSECDVGDLAAKQVSSNGAAGTIVYVYTLTNTSTSNCYTYGWPGVGYLGTSGQSLPTTPTRVTKDMVGSTGSPKQFTIAPGGEGSFRVTLSDVTSTDGGGCVNAATIEITPPNDKPTIKLSLDPKISTCGSGTVTPMQPGTDAAQGA